MDWSSEDKRQAELGRDSGLDLGPTSGGLDELDLATDYSTDSQFSTEFSRLRAAMVDHWNILREDRTAPICPDLNDLPEYFATSDAVALTFGEFDLAPDILHLGSQVASDAAWVRGRSAPALEFLRSMYSQAVSSTLPMDFSEEFALGEDQVVDCRGVAFPFSSDGLNVDIVIARFDLAEGDILELTAGDAETETEILLAPQHIQ